MNCSFLVHDISTLNSSVIFILESPHTDEIAEGLPLLGESGVVFSQALLTNKAIPAGLQLSKGNISFSVMNTFQNALQLSPELCSVYSEIDGLIYKELGFQKFKSSVRKIIETNPQALMFVDSYKSRIRQLIYSSNQNVKLVVCGITAQVYFEYALNISDIWFGCVATKYIMGKSLEVLYVEHPSPKNFNTHWAPVIDNRKLIFLQKFVNGKLST